MRIYTLAIASTDGLDGMKIAYKSHMRFEVEISSSKLLLFYYFLRLRIFLRGPFAKL
jgi:hypothetical protein